MRQFDSIIIGGGAAGLMCAAVAGRRGRRVAVLDHANKVGKKILMSGGGRCNFTNYFVEPDNFVSDNPHFCVSALSRYTPYDFIALVQGYDLAYHEKTLGQLFCDHKSKDILNILLAECEAGGVEIHTHCGIEAVERTADEGPVRFKLATSQGTFGCESLVVATGGLSIPTMGATGFGYRLAGQFGLAVTERRASLVPYTLSGRRLELAQSLAGVSLPARVSTERQAFSEALLFTHRGLSGPAILQITNYWRPGEGIEVDFLPTESLGDLVRDWREGGEKAELKTLLARHLPKRFVQAWLETETELARIQAKPIAELSKRDIASLERAFHHWSCVPPGTEGYRTAEVTLGGVSTDEVSSKTFEAKQAPGLYFIGEVLDVTGWLGGFNFQWAWASGWCAGQYV